jgi:hypothetical protein
VHTHEKKRDRHFRARKKKIKRLPAEWGKWQNLSIPKMEIEAAVASFARLASGERSRFSHVADFLMLFVVLGLGIQTLLGGLISYFLFVSSYISLAPIPLCEALNICRYVW